MANLARKALCLLENNKLPLFRLFTIFAAAFLLGVFLASFFTISWDKSWQIFIFIILLLLLTALFNFNYQNYVFTLVTFFIILLIAGFVYFVGFDSLHPTSLPYNDKVKILGKISNKPEFFPDKQRVRIMIRKIDGQTIEGGANILVYAPHFPKLSYGQIIEVSGNINEPGNFEGFDYEAYLKRYLTFGIIYYPEELRVIPTKSNWQEKFVGSLYAISSRFEHSINSSIHEPHASLASGLILGIKRNIPDELVSQLNTTGLTHIIALSGYNVTIIISILSAFLVSVLGRKKTFWTGLLIIFAFVILTGAMPSVIRASLFSGLILFGKTLGKRADQTNVLIFTALIMVLANPYVLKFDLGFQLSFLAFCGIIYISPILNAWIESNKLRKLPRMIKIPLIETLSAQLAVAPLIFLQFDRLSIISPLANLAVIWLIPASLLPKALTSAAFYIEPNQQLGRTCCHLQFLLRR